MTRFSAADLRTALIYGEIQPFYQPLVDLRTGITTGYEILARWKHRTGGTSSPADFIPLAESSGLITALTRQLLKEAFRSASLLPGDFTLSVNISPRQLQNRSLAGTILSLANDHDFSLKRLTVEITETAIVSSAEGGRRTAADLRSMGIKLALDDFGTGYSSLQQLQALDFDEIKVDRSFVRSITTERESRKIVSAIIGLGRSLGLRTVAEGVEEQSQADMLLCLGCELGQGWLFGKPAPVKILDKRTQVRIQPTHTRSETSSNPILCLEALPTQGPAQLQAIYDGAPVGLYFLDCHLRYVNLNRRIAEMNGLPVQQHLGRTIEEVNPHVYSQIEPYLRHALAGEATQGLELTISQASPAQAVRSVLVTYQPARDEAGDVIGISAVVLDISDRKRAEQALRESEDHYRHMVELTPQIPWIADRDGNNLEISPRWGDLTGQSPQQCRGLGWRRAIHPDDLDRLEEAYFSAFRSGQPFDLQYRVTNTSGSWTWVRSRGVPRRDATGEILRWYGSTECIDDQKQHQNELEAGSARLQAVLDAVPLRIGIVEAPSGRIVSRNPAIHTILQQDSIEIKRNGGVPTTRPVIL